MRVLILGAGATGAYFGARLIQSGSAVSFLVRPARAERLRQDGLRVLSPHGDFSGAVDTLTSIPAGRHFDLILLACKAYDLDTALAAIAPAVGPATRGPGHNGPSPAGPCPCRPRRCRTGPWYAVTGAVRPCCAPRGAA